jgi:hypothetical protein
MAKEPEVSANHTHAYIPEMPQLNGWGFLL